VFVHRPFSTRRRSMPFGKKAPPPKDPNKVRSVHMRPLSPSHIRQCSPRALTASSRRLFNLDFHLAVISDVKVSADPESARARGRTRVHKLHKLLPPARATAWFFRVSRC
jgi:hypothetical protein